jgi:5-methylcytosine-specific restriction enzyme B
VFGELIYLLEYRDEQITLASGESFSFPKNVNIIGTMNTADRSIALVDHALRRRFAFLRLYPDYDLLTRYHQDTDFNPTGLIDILERINLDIGDMNYSVGVTFFVIPNIQKHIKSIWQMEIEPYLEEYFFDDQSKVDNYRWSNILEKILG